MRKFTIFLIFVLIVGKAAAQPQEAVIGITPQWFQFEANSPEDGGQYVEFRRYAFVINPSVDGTPTFTDLRNIMTFYCAISPNQASYLLILTPREINVPTLFGNQYFADKDTLFAFGDSGLVLGSGEVQKNQLFFDIEFRNRYFFEGIRSDETIYLYFDDFHRLVMRPMDEEFAVLGYSSFAELVEGSIRGSIGDVEIRRVSSGELLDACR